MNVIIAVDIGAKGAIAILKDGKLASILDMPIRDKDYNIRALAALFRTHPTATVVIENVHAFRAQGVTSTFNFGRAKGIIEALAVAHCRELVSVAPQTWKKTYPSFKGKDRDEQKAEAVKLASQLEPKAEFSRAKKTGKGRINLDGRAEAYLMAIRQHSLMPTIL